MKIKTRKNLNISSLNNKLKELFKTFPDNRSIKSIPIEDFLSIGLAVYQTKIPSLLLLDENRDEGHVHRNLKKMYQVEHIPSDTQLREILDRIPTSHFHKAFDLVFRTLQNEKALQDFKFYNGELDSYLVAIDGTGFFSSNNVNCDCCLVKAKKHSDDFDELKYQHQLLGASIVHPHQKIVLPLTPEPISNKDGNTKNDCELVAAKRLYNNIRNSHPKLPITIVQDALYSTAPNIEELKKNQMDFIIVTKKDKNKRLFGAVEARKSSLNDVFSNEKTIEFGDKVKKIKKTKWWYVNNVPLTDESKIEVNCYGVEEEIKWTIGAGHKKGKEQVEKVQYVWITNININNDNIEKLINGGRCRWKIENEAFNTLKNQGYELEHNYGHGKKYLANNFATLAMLAFLIDQVQATYCEVFQRALARIKRKKRIWDHIKTILLYVEIDDWMIFLQLASGDLKIKSKLQKSD